MTNAAVRDYYGPDRWGRGYDYIDWNAYPTYGRHRALDLRKLSPNGAYSIAVPIVTLTAGTISHLYQYPLTGREIVVDTGRKRGRYEIHSHAADPAPRGTRVAAGGRIGKTATRDEQPGAIGVSWFGIHDHFVISDYPDAGHNIDRPRYDPAEFIRTALAAPAGGKGEPIEPPKPAPVPEEEEDDMAPKLIRRNEKGEEWSLVHPSYRGETDLERGYLVTTDENRAKAWARLHGKGWGVPGTYTANVNRADYIAIQEAARAEHAAHLATLAAIKG